MNAKIIETVTGKTFVIPALSKSSRPWFCTTGGGVKIKRGRYTFDLKWNNHGEPAPDGLTRVQAGFDLTTITWVTRGRRKKFLATWFPVDGREGSPEAKFKIVSPDGEDRPGVILLRRKGE